MKRNRYRSRAGQRKIPLLGILGICFGAALLIALVVGLILNATLDDETYYRLTTKPRNKQDDTILFVPSVPNVIASPYRFGGDVADLGGVSAVSLALNASDGTYLYQSDALNYFQKGKSGGETLATTLALLANYRIYVSAVFYPSAPAERNSALQYAKEGEEIAVLREYFQLGGGDLVLCGLDVTGNADATDAYLKAVKLALGQNPVGVAIPYEILLREDSGKILERLLSYCDFVALDLRGSSSEEPLDEFLGKTKYSYTQYHLRLLFSQKQTAWINDARNMGLVNYEILN